jgi:predicted metal-binding protein
MEKKSMLEDLKTFAIQRGADEAKLIKVDQIVVSDWVYWKCRYGCPDYGKTLTCPPYSPTPEQTRSLLKDYDSAIIVKNYSSTYHNLILELERKAFLTGFYKAFGLTAGQCHVCESCNVETGVCLHPNQARPSMESCGIDVFSTARNAGFDMSVKQSKEEKYGRICLLLVE